MSSISLIGKFYYKGIGKVRIVSIVGKDQARLNEWWAKESIFTHLFKRVSPDDGTICPVIYVTENATANLEDQDDVMITISTRPEKRGNGIKTLNVTKKVEN